ncbi:MAG TPA: YgjV family protein, partial [Candidatus Paceibacterota bacterium]|nr:YgjV family protein [Candidatus Paceibacterota bacterium]
HMIIFGIIGLLAISFAIWIKNDKQQDIIFIFGGIFLLIYSIFIKDLVFIFLQLIFILSAIIELIKIKKIK